MMNENKIYRLSMILLFFVLFVKEFVRNLSEFRLLSFVHPHFFIGADAS